MDDYRDEWPMDGRMDGYIDECVGVWVGDE